MSSWIVNFFNQAFFQRLLATVIGVLLGGAIALWVNRRSQRNAALAEEKKEEDRLRVQRIQALHAAKDTISRNAGRMENADDYFNFDLIAYFNVDPQELDFLIPELLKTGVGFELFQKINNYRYELVRFAREIDARYEMVWHRQSQGLRIEARESIYAHREDLIPMGKKLEEDIDRQLEKEGTV